MQIKQSIHPQNQGYFWLLLSFLVIFHIVMTLSQISQYGWKGAISLNQSILPHSIRIHPILTTFVSSARLGASLSCTS